MKLTIGRVDKANFPDLSLKDIDIKIDSGAYTSSIYCSKIKEFTKENEQFISFTLLGPEHKLYTNKQFTFKKYSAKKVKSSNGQSEERFMIQTTIEIFNTSFPIYLTLSERKEMKFPILIGRKFLNKKFIIDPSKKDLSYKLKTN